MFLSLAPLVVIVALGYMAMHVNYVSSNTISEISKITFNLLFPFYLFINIAQSDLSSSLSYSVFINFYGAVFVVFLASFLLLLKFKNSSYQSASVFALGSTYSNTVIIGIPVLLRVVSQEAAALVFVIISFHSAMLFALTGILAGLAGPHRFNYVNFIKNLISNPLLIGIFSGLIWSFFKLPLPQILISSLELITAPALTIALFILGANLKQYKLAGHYNQVILATLIKLILLPLTVWLIATHVFSFAPLVVTVLVVLTACPTGVNAYIVACQQNTSQHMMAGTVVLSTLGSALTIPLWLYLLA
jgi:hypothetical protein